MSAQGDDSKAGAYFTRWNDVDIIFHLAPFMNEEQHRRLCGNDIGMSWSITNNADVLFVSNLGVLIYYDSVTQGRWSSSSEPGSGDQEVYPFSQFNPTLFCLFYLTNIDFRLGSTSNL